MRLILKFAKLLQDACWKIKIWLNLEFVKESKDCLQEQVLYVQMLVDMPTSEYLRAKLYFQASVISSPLHVYGYHVQEC